MKILYIIGPTRSGSTLLSRVLNEAPGIVAVGEVVSLDVAFQSCRAQRLGASASGNFVGNDARENAARRFSGLCGCGCPLTDCTVWAHVDRTVFGDPPDYSAWSWTASRPPLRTFLHNGADRWLQSVGTDLAPVAESIYRELARATDARVLVDDSKTPLFGYFLAAQPWAEVIPVRLVRDPRATADSWARPKPSTTDLRASWPILAVPITCAVDAGPAARSAAGPPCSAIVATGTACPDSAPGAAWQMAASFGP